MKYIIKHLFLQSFLIAYNIKEYNENKEEITRSVVRNLRGKFSYNRGVLTLRFPKNNNYEITDLKMLNSALFTFEKNNKLLVNLKPHSLTFHHGIYQIIFYISNLMDSYSHFLNQIFCYDAEIIYRKVVTENGYDKEIIVKENIPVDIKIYEKSNRVTLTSKSDLRKIENLKISISTSGGLFLQEIIPLSVTEYNGIFKIIGRISSNKTLE